MVNKTITGYGADILVVPNVVLSFFAILPCKPRLALKSAMHTNESESVHAKIKTLAPPLLWLSSITATLGWPLFHIAMDAAMVNKTCTNVPKTSHARVNGPIQSPTLPSDAPRLKARKEVNACWSLWWNLVSLRHIAPENRREDATASYITKKKKTKKISLGLPFRKQNWSPPYSPVRNYPSGIRTTRI
jgi:hypothetical protein